MIKLTGRRPADLGVGRGRFRAARSWKPNWVSSQVDAADAHFVAPLVPADGDGAAGLRRLRARIEAMPRMHVVEARPDYLHVEASTPALGFVDDLELVGGDGAIHVRSAARLGIRDFGVNRKRVETLRAALAA